MAKSAKFDLNSMSLEELKALEKETKRAIRSYESRMKKEALAAAEAVAKELGFSLNELTGAKKARAGRAAPMYQHPENPELTWSGHGRQPAWFKEAIEGGKSREDLKIR